MRRSKNNIGRIAATVIGMATIIGTACSPTEKTDLGIFDECGDVGSPTLKGSSSFNAQNQTYTLEGSGENIWFDNDHFHFLWKNINGDFILQAQMKFEGEGQHEHRKIGLMLREELTKESRHINGVVHGDGLTSLQYRSAIGAQTEEKTSPDKAPDVVKIERRGNNFILSTAVFGEPFTTIEVENLELNPNLYVGLFICSHNDSVMEKATFSNVQLTIPAKPDLVQYKEYIGSRIEIMDVATGSRKEIYSATNSLQAPNWTPDGKTLIYNCEGKLYAFDINSSTISEINTDFATNNNNDHVLSFDGKLLGISNHTADDNGQSNVYIVPITGGVPERITKEGPSYLHGFSPDGKSLIYTAGRNNASHLDIYKMDLETREEIRLTDAEGLDDGSEYAPDGSYIYFNSNRTGTMQIWRMKPDGSEQEQLTFDELNDWFPHVSPDGQTLVFITFGTDVDSGDHPFYKHVYIRTMPITGGEPKVIAYLYGGQGTMNVPSWSPDGKQIAFISNSIIEKSKTE